MNILHHVQNALRIVVLVVAVVTFPIWGFLALVLTGLSRLYSALWDWFLDGKW